jgi:hypothetical protein
MKFPENRSGGVGLGSADRRTDGRTVGDDAVTVAFRICFTSTDTAGQDFLSLLRTKLRRSIQQNVDRQKAC